MLKLRFKNNNHNSVWLVEPKVSIGTAPENSLTLPGPGIAPRHAEIMVSPNGLKLNNLANGKNIWVNGKPVEECASVKASDSIRIGTIELQIVDPKDEKKGSPTVTRGEQSTGWALKANHSALSNRVFPIKTHCVIGRSGDCDITLAATHLSRRHAELTVKEGMLYIRDLNSSNGTYLNGKRIGEAHVKRGDELRFDTLCFGVIGPANDMGKTSVRSAGAPVQPAASAGNGVANENKISQPDDKSVQPRRTVRPQEQYSSNETEQSTEGGAGLWIGIILIAAAVAAGMYLGYIPNPL